MNTPHSRNDPAPFWSDPPSRTLVMHASASSPSPRSLSPDLDDGPDPDPKIPRSAKAERDDGLLLGIKQFLETMERPPAQSDDQYRRFIRRAMNYFVLRGKLYRKARDGGVQLIPPPEKRTALIRYAHDELGHKGAFATTRSLLVRFWWPGLNEEVRWYVKTCHECQVRQTEYFYIPPVIPEVPSIFRKAHMDTFLMPKAGNYRYVLHARCATLSYPEARATTSESGEVLAAFIFQEILCRWGALDEIVTDNGTPWVAAVDSLGDRYGIHHIRISGYNSRANGIVESKHFDVREAIMKTCRGEETKWRQALPQVLWAERVTIRKATGYSPYYMAHGVHPLLPFDIQEATYLAPTQDFGISTEELVALRARQLAKRPDDIAFMRETVTASRTRNLERFEKRHKDRIIDFDFQPGALVLVRNSHVEESLNRKTKPRYLGPMVVVRKTVGTSYIVAELDGAQSQLRVAGFRLIPYFPRTHTDVPLIPSLPDAEDTTEDDPADVQLLSSLRPEQRTYSSIPPPSF